MDMYFFLNNGCSDKNRTMPVENPRIDKVKNELSCPRVRARGERAGSIIQGLESVKWTAFGIHHKAILQTSVSPYKARPYTAIKQGIFLRFQASRSIADHHRPSQRIADHRSYLPKNGNSVASLLPTMECFTILLRLSSQR